MTLEHTITDDELQNFIINSERYALGRMTYVVGEVCDTIKKYLKQLSNNTLFVLINDIKNHPKGGGSYGMPCDTEEWLDLLAILEQEWQERKHKK